jgi:hypothetical protein
VGLGQFFFMHRGQAVRRFQHLRIAEWPPEGGFSSVCDAVPLEQFVPLQEKSIRLLQHIGWDGVAMVEYRYDPASGRAVLMEVNGRFWGSFPWQCTAAPASACLPTVCRGRGGCPACRPAGRHLALPDGGHRMKRLRRILLQPGQIRDRTFRVRPVRGAALRGRLPAPSVGALHPRREERRRLKDIKPFIRDVGTCWAFEISSRGSSHGPLTLPHG